MWCDDLVVGEDGGPSLDIVERHEKRGAASNINGVLLYQAARARCYVFFFAFKDY